MRYKKDVKKYIEMIEKSGENWDLFLKTISTRDQRIVTKYLFVKKTSFTNMTKEFVITKQRIHQIFQGVIKNFQRFTSRIS